MQAMTREASAKRLHLALRSGGIPLPEDGVATGRPADRGGLPLPASRRRTRGSGDPRAVCWCDSSCASVVMGSASGVSLGQSFEPPPPDLLIDD